MGISPFYAEAIAREHRFKPLHGDVFTIGRQTMLFNPKQALHLLRKTGVSVPLADPSTLALDTETNLAGQGYISDRAFFGLLGIDRLRSLDHDAYEGADLIHDLNKPLPDHLAGIADVIIDGSTIDNVFNPALALINLSRMLRPGGRLISINVGSNHYCPYVIPTPAWFLDFFVANDYATCTVYTSVYESDGRVAVLALEPSQIGADTPNIPTVEASTHIGLFVIAEKSEKPTPDIRTPIQFHYHTAAQRRDYLDLLRHITPRNRPHILSSRGHISVKPPRGYVLVPPES